MQWYGLGLGRSNMKEKERIVTLYMQALGDTKLPECVWKKVARVNQLVLDDKK